MTDCPTSDFTGFVWQTNSRQWGWTRGFTGWEKIFWLGPLGFMFRERR